MFVRNRKNTPAQISEVEEYYDDIDQNQNQYEYINEYDHLQNNYDYPVQYNDYLEIYENVYNPGSSDSYDHGKDNKINESSVISYKTTKF